MVFNGKAWVESEIVDVIWLRLGRWAFAKWPNRFSSSIDFLVNPVQFLLKIHQDTRFEAEGSSPEVNEHCFEVDGAICRFNMKAGIGGYLKDHAGKILSAFSCPVHHSSKLDVELEAIYFVLLVVRGNKNRNIQILRICSDSKEAIQALNNDNITLLNCSDVVNRIRILQRGLVRVRFQYLRRDLNSRADWLAKNGISRKRSWVIWE